MALSQVRVQIRVAPGQGLSITAPEIIKSDDCGTLTLKVKLELINPAWEGVCTLDRDFKNFWSRQAKCATQKAALSVCQVQTRT